MPARSLLEVCSVVTDAAARFDARTLDRDRAAAAMQVWATIMHAADAAFAMAAARVAECGPPPSAGASSAADYVAKQTGTTANKAKETIKAGEGLQEHHELRARATSGGLSADQTAAIADALALAPEAERKLLEIAERSSIGTLREECASAKAPHQDLPAIEKRIHANRSLRRYRDAEGAEHLHAVGTKATMSRVDAALKRLIDERFEQARAEGVCEPLEAYAYDALVAMADGRVDSDPKERVRYLGVLRIDFEALIRGKPETDETCEIAGLGPISVETARELLGESILKLVITKGVNVLNVTHLGRGPNTAQKIALLWMQPGCAREAAGGERGSRTTTRPGSSTPRPSTRGSTRPTRCATPTTT
jgi:hypothetical protein